MSSLRILVLLSILSPVIGLPRLHADSLPAEEFGYGRMKINDHAAIGERPLLVVLLTDLAGKPFAHSPAAYENLAFGAGSTGGMRGAPSIRDFFSEMSKGRFTWRKAAFMGPIPMEPGNSIELRYTRLKRLLVDLGFDYRQFDSNQDGRIDDHELGVLVIDTYTDAGGAVRGSRPGCVVIERYGPQKGLQICNSIAATGHRASFQTMVHELSHLLGTIDLYGAGTHRNLNDKVSLMGPTPGVDNFSTLYLDPWHRMQLGWIKPRVVNLADLKSERFTLRAPNLDPLFEGGNGAPLLLYDGQKSTTHFLLLEYRNRFPSYGAGPGRQYDNDVAGSGVVVWSVTQNPDGSVKYEPAPGATSPDTFDPLVYAVGDYHYERGRGSMVWSGGSNPTFLGAVPGTILPYYLDIDHRPSDADEIHFRLVKTGFSEIVTVSNDIAQMTSLREGYDGGKIYSTDSSGELFVRTRTDGEFYYSAPTHIVAPAPVQKLKATLTWDGREMLLIGTPTGIWLRKNDVPGGSMGGWDRIGNPMTGAFHLLTNSLSLGLEIFVSDSAGRIWAIYEDVKNPGHFKTPQGVGRFPLTMNRILGVQTDPFGGRFVYAETPQGGIAYSHCQSESAEWTDWALEPTTHRFSTWLMGSFPFIAQFQIGLNSISGQVVLRTQMGEEPWSTWMPQFTVATNPYPVAQFFSFHEGILAWTRTQFGEFLTATQLASGNSREWKPWQIVAPYFSSELHGHISVSGRYEFYYKDRTGMLRYFRE